MSNVQYKRGESRGQASFLPPRIEDYVGAANPVRAIDAYVAGVELAQLGFVHADRGVSAGQPPYDPGALLKLYLYGYLNRVRSSRALAREAVRNVEVMWLLCGQTPSFGTIAGFRAANAAALGAANRDFVRLLGRLKLLGGKLVAIDGAFFDGNAGKGSMVTAKRLRAQLAALDQDIATYAAQLAENDAHEAGEAASAEAAGDAGARMAELLSRRAQAAASLEEVSASGETQLSRTDPDARLLSKRGQSVSGYNVQIGVDAAHKLIVASAVVNDGNDTGQLHEVAAAAKAALGVETLQVVADAGYHNGETLRACEAEGIEAFVPEPARGRRPEDEGRFPREAFAYDEAADVYRCPGGQVLHPGGQRVDASGKLRRRYVSRKSECRACPLRQQCLGPGSDKREIERWEHEAVLERQRARMAQDDELAQDPATRADAVLPRRKALVEHPFGTLKCRAGYRHFLVRGFARVRGEWGLMALCYNLGRVLTIIGVASFIAWIAAFAAVLEALMGFLAGTGAMRPRLHRPRRTTACNRLHHPFATDIPASAAAR